MFGPALALCLAAQFLGGFLVQRKMWGRFGAAPAVSAMPVATPTTNVVIVTTTGTSGTVSIPGGAAPSGLVDAVISVAGTLTVVANLAALGWFGMWMGLNSKSSNMATLKTIVFVEIFPWFVVSFASALAVPLVLFPLMKGAATAPSRIMVWYPLITSGLATLLSLSKDIAFSLWARRKLYSEFRERATRTWAPIRLATPPPLPRPGVPPVAAAT